MKIAGKPRTLEEKMRLLIGMMILPLGVVLVVAFSLLYAYNSRYSDILHNVTTASEFNQDFKEDIDLQMYYYVVGSHYSSGLPTDQVRAAQELARSLLATTTYRDSYKDIDGVLNLCKNLEEKMDQITRTEDFDQRQSQLDNNIYGLTSLIQEYMYNYLYHESVHLDEIQEEMSRRLFFELVIVIAVAAAFYLLAFRAMLRFGRSITAPLGLLTRRVQAIGDGDLTVHTPIETNEYETRLLSEGFENMVERLNLLIEQNRREQARLRGTELALLQAQINPHFLYNTLDTIVWLVEMGKNEQAVEMVTSLSSFFRSMLSNGRDIISLREEEQHIRSYLEIQQVRYKDILTYEMSIDPALDACQVPKLTLQPLVENALYHGIKLKRLPGRIIVRGYRKGDRILLEVSDDGVGMDEERLMAVRGALRKEQPAGFGLSTVHERLQLLYGEEYGLEIRSSPGKGTLVIAVLPACETGRYRPADNNRGTEGQVL